MLDQRHDEEKTAPTIDEIFNQAIDTSNFDVVFADPEVYRDLILANIQQIASCFCDGNYFVATDETPEWLVDSLLSYGAEFDWLVQVSWISSNIDEMNDKHSLEWSFLLLYCWRIFKRCWSLHVLLIE